MEYPNPSKTDLPLGLVGLWPNFARVGAIGHFRTTAAHLNEHKQQLTATKQLIEKAQANGWTRQVEMNQTVQANLEAIIAGLEAPDDDSQA
ncbi:site-specific recombinase [Leptolyngbya sp. Heron Island J]|uniref:hypothetical protein n=1 Tax=Leptolyngbya sp. Heron Island J TaxID=1385935 RepID=UPI0003B9B2EF|nr:hypothetical protein [Leptolyngbya sp. Heron Island J]ESA37955.1 site-specific recombinase [Leptolyngbya sp. Heron Island J]